MYLEIVEEFLLSLSMAAIHCGMLKEQNEMWYQEKKRIVERDQSVLDGTADAKFPSNSWLIRSEPRPWMLREPCRRWRDV